LAYWRDRRDAGWLPAGMVVDASSLANANLWFVEGGFFPPAHTSSNPFGRLVQRIVRRLIRAPLARQNEFNAYIVRAVNTLSAERDTRDGPVP